MLTKGFFLMTVKTLDYLVKVSKAGQIRYSIFLIYSFHKEMQQVDFSRPGLHKAVCPSCKAYFMIDTETCNKTIRELITTVQMSGIVVNINLGKRFLSCGTCVQAITDCIGVYWCRFSCLLRCHLSNLRKYYIPQGHVDQIN